MGGESVCDRKLWVDSEQKSASRTIRQSAAVTASRPTQRPTLLLRQPPLSFADEGHPATQSHVYHHGEGQIRESFGWVWVWWGKRRAVRAEKEKVQAPHLKISKFKDRPACPTPNRSFPPRAPDSAQPSSLPQKHQSSKMADEVYDGAIGIDLGKPARFVLLSARSIASAVGAGSK